MALFFTPFALTSQDDIGQDSTSIIESYEETVTIMPSNASDKTVESSSDSTTVDSSAYMRDLRNAMKGMGSMDPNNVYTVQAMLPAGEVLVLATASGCSLLNDPDDGVTGTVRPLEFSFHIADLEDCGKVTEDIISGLQSEIAAEWSNLGGYGAEGNVTSSTRLQEIGVRKGNGASERNGRSGSDFSVSVQDLANAFLAANLEIKMIPTTTDGVYVLHFDISDNTSAEEITQAMANIDPEKLKEVGDAINLANEKIMNATPEELSKMEEEFKTFLEKNEEILRKEIEDGKNILEELSKSDVSSKECSSLPLDQCKTVSKCGIVKLNGTEKCMVSPKTVFWLMETSCGLQSKAGLLSIVRDFVNAGIMTESNHHTLRQSFDLGQICNAIVHTYLSADIAETEQHEAKRGFEL